MGWSGQGGGKWIGRGGDPSAVATPFGDASGGSEASELLIDAPLIILVWSGGGWGHFLFHFIFFFFAPTPVI